MFRRGIALLLLPTVLLTQWASARQCHGCQQGAGHNHDPHIHLTGWPFTGFGSQVQDRREKRHNGCCHHHCSKRHGNQGSGDEDEGTPARYHDDSTDNQGGGVVYLPTAFIHGWITGRTLTSSDDVGNTLFQVLSVNLV